jgi:CheY-like chemotaxis protein
MLLEINKVTHRAAELCKQMLAYSGKSRLIMKPVNLSELVEEMGHMLKISISKKATLLYNLSKNPWPIKADATQIRQIIMNLIINASEALNDKSGIISITTGWMECDRPYLMERRLPDEIQEGNYVYLEVSDTGIGMNPAILGKIFDPFFTTKFTGRGLGLAAVLGIVRSHNGAIQVSSEPDKGTTFKVLFPALLLAGVTTDDDQPIKENWKGSGALLLVDDEEAVRNLCCQMLQRLGFEVLIANDGRQALDIFREHRGEIRCILLDLTMPRLDGEETFQELCRIDPNVRVIMSSGFSEPKTLNPSIEKRLAGFIQKPYQLSDLTALLKKVLGDG